MCFLQKEIDLMSLIIWLQFSLFLRANIILAWIMLVKSPYDYAIVNKYNSAFLVVGIVVINKACIY